MFYIIPSFIKLVNLRIVETSPYMVGKTLRELNLLMRVRKGLSLSQYVNELTGRSLHLYDLSMSRLRDSLITKFIKL